MKIFAVVVVSILAGVALGYAATVAEFGFPTQEPQLGGQKRDPNLANKPRLAEPRVQSRTRAVPRPGSRWLAQLRRQGDARHGFDCRRRVGELSGAGREGALLPAAR